MGEHRGTTIILRYLAGLHPEDYVLEQDVATAFDLPLEEARRKLRLMREDGDVDADHLGRWRATPKGRSTFPPTTSLPAANPRATLSSRIVVVLAKFDGEASTQQVLDALRVRAKSDRARVRSSIHHVSTTHPRVRRRIDARGSLWLSIPNPEPEDFHVVIPACEAAADWLSRHGGWHTAADVALAVDASHAALAHQLPRLVDNGRAQRVRLEGCPAWTYARTGEVLPETAIADTLEGPRATTASDQAAA